MKLSFVIPVYNPDVPTLEKCVRSLMAQSLSKDDFETIFVLDGEDKEAMSAIKRNLDKKANSKIEVIEHGGACKARNHGASLASGLYFCFFDCDCEIEVHAAQAWISTFEKHPDIGFVYGDYKFSDVEGSILAEEWDPYLLKVNNYISCCYPMRRELFPGFDEFLESLQDWDLWLSVMEKGGKGKRLAGYSFSTLAPRENSISGQGCTDENWLKRRDVVTKKHGIKDKSVCVSSVSARHIGIDLAKLIDADYRDQPTVRPHRYKTVVQVGFSFEYGKVAYHASAFSDKNVTNKILFWDRNSVEEAYTRVSCRALKEYSESMDGKVRHYVEDKESQRIMAHCGFNAEIMPLPMSKVEVKDVPEVKKFLADVGPEYADVMMSIDEATPDIHIDVLTGAQRISDYVGMISLHRIKTLSDHMKRVAINGRHNISNVQAYGMGYIADDQSADTFIPQVINKMRNLCDTKPNPEVRETYEKTLSPTKLMEVL